VSADLRAAVVDAAREMLRLGLVSGSSGNVSARHGESILITPAGAPYEQMAEDDLVELGLEGAATGGGSPSTEWRVHAAIYRARPDIGAIVHTHSVHATAWSFLDEPLETGTEELEAAAGGTVLTAPYAPTGSEEIARHGVVGAGTTASAALATCVVVERQAQVAWLLRR
jgi:L-fuculose-phosphate aldolase